MIESSYQDGRQSLTTILPAEVLPRKQFRWNTSEEIYAILIAQDRHQEWLTKDVVCCPSNGSLLLFDRSSVSYRKDGFVWKKRKDKKHTREDHMKLRVRGSECIYGCYAHSAILPTFHRRCYWLLQNPNIILVHYLNAPQDELRSSLPTLCNTDRRRWTREELRQQLEPMYAVPNDPQLRKQTNCEQMTEDELSRIIDKLLANQQSDGVQVTAQWVLSLNSTTKYLLPLADAKPRTLQMHNGNGALPGKLEFLVGTMHSTASSQIGRQPDNQQTATDCGLSFQEYQHPKGCPDSADSSSPKACSMPHSTSYSLPSQTAISDPPSPCDQVETKPCLLRTDIKHGLQDQTLSQLQTDFDLSCSPMDVMASALDAGTTSEHGLCDDFCMTAEEIHHALSSHEHIGCSPDRLAASAGEFDNFDLFSELSMHSMVSMSPTRQLEQLECAMASTDQPSDRSPARVKLTALAPEWSYSEGGCKVLFVGPWRCSASVYTCIFDGKSVSADLVQEGVLSCITPQHPEGVVQVQVSCNDTVISESSAFEFRDRQYEPSRYRAWFSCENAQLQEALRDRLEIFESCLDVVFHQPIITADGANLEHRVISLINHLQQYAWKTTTILPSTFKSLTLMHLAAALGFDSLIKLLITWRMDQPNDILNHETSCLSQDANGSTPLHWSCALGRLDATAILCNVDRSPLNFLNRDGMSPITLARAFLHQHIVDYLEPRGIFTDTAIDTSWKCSSMGGIVSHSLLGSRQPASSEPTSGFSHGNPVIPSILELSPNCVTEESTPVNCNRKFNPLLRTDTQSELDDEDSFVDVETISDNESSYVLEPEESQEPSNGKIRTLAEHIIAAMPDRIKSSAGSSDHSGASLLLQAYRERSSSRSSYSSALSCAEDSGVCTPLTTEWTDPDSLARFRLSSSPVYSPESIYNINSSTSFTGCSYPSPGYPSTSANNSSFHLRSDSPPPSTQMLGEYFNAGSTNHVEYGLAQLTLSDTEQRRLYHAATIIQNAFRQFKDKKQQQKEIEAAIIIQTYYRRFKEFTTLRNVQREQMAATRIQSQFRTYYAQKRFKKSRDAALLIQHHYRAYKEHEQLKRSRNAAVLIQQKFRTHYNRKKSAQLIPDDSSHSTTVAVCGIATPKVTGSNSN